MSNGKTFYQCKCGGEITEEWDSVATYISCTSCLNPEPENMGEEIFLEEVDPSDKSLPF